MVNKNIAISINKKKIENCQRPSVTTCKPRTLKFVFVCSVRIQVYYMDELKIAKKKSNNEAQHFFSTLATNTQGYFFLVTKYSIHRFHPVFLLSLDLFELTVNV